MTSTRLDALAEPARRILGARVAWVDRDYFRNKIGAADDALLDETLLSHLALISEAQVSPNDVNFPFEVAHQSIAVTRPPTYGRVIVVHTEWGEYDVKGAGVAHMLRPSPTQHANGLLTLPAAVAEICTEQLARRALAVEGIETARCLALFMLPIYLRDPLAPSGRVRCALLVRESFPRFLADPEDEDSALALLEFSVCCERALRRVGLTTTSASTNIAFTEEGMNYVARVDNVPVPRVVAAAIADVAITCPFVGQGEFDTLNVQLCMDLSRQKLRMVDFGSVEFRSAFDKPMLAACLSRLSHTASVSTKMPQLNQRKLRMEGYACALTVSPAYDPVQVPSAMAPLLEMVPMSEAKEVSGAHLTTKRLAKIASEELERSNSDHEICKWAANVIDQFASL